MKKIIFIIVVLLIFIGLVGMMVAHQSNTNKVSSTKISVITTLPLLKNLVEIIGKDEVIVYSIIKGPSCNHEYEPTTGDMKKIAGGKVFIKAGLGFDTWVDKLVRSVGNEKLLVVDASCGVIPIVDTEEEDHDNEEKEESHELGNPHYWGNPDNVKLMAKNILEALITVSPNQQEYYTNNYQKFLGEIDQTAAKLKNKVAQLSDKRVVSYSAAFPYFYDYFGFQNIMTVETTCEQEVSPRKLAEVAQTMKNQKIQVLVGEEVYPNFPQNLAKETKAKLVLLWPATNDSESYLATLQNNVEKLVSALR